MLAYRILVALAGPLLRLRLSRQGRPPAPPPATAPRRLWLHGASNGELQSARPLIEALLGRDPQLVLVVTCNTATARAMVAAWGFDRVHAGIAPADLRRPLRRFLDCHRPGALVLIESELWPNRLAAMRRRGLPVAVLSARLSGRSAARWGRTPGIAREVMAAISYLAAQDAESGARFRALGLPAERVGPFLDLKRQVAPPAPTFAPALSWPRDETVLAASTHPGEEAMTLDAFAAARTARPGLRLILAPRHPRRSAEIARLLADRGFTFARRSSGAVPDPDTHVFLADTMGEMALWYSQAAWCLTGGSLVATGGHTPFEPVAHGCAVLHGPHVANFAAVYRDLDSAGASRCVADVPALAAAMRGLDAAAAGTMAGRARELVAAAPDGLAAALVALGRLTGNPALAADSAPASRSADPADCDGIGRAGTR